MPMLVAALRLVAQQLTTRRIAARLGEMTSLVAAQAAALGFEVPPRHAPGIVGLRTGAGMPPAAELVRRLAALKPRPVLVSERLGVIRVSPHLYNTPDDLRCLLDGLREVVRPASRL